MEYAAVILAAGQGKRMKAGQNKQFLMLDGCPLIVRTLSVFEEDPWCERIIVVANDREIEKINSLLNEWKITKVEAVTAGGKERQDSVLEGLRQLGSDPLVLIHDGARPFITQERIHLLVEKASTDRAAILGVKMKDTVKKVQDGVVIDTIERSSVWSVQTPQAFVYSIIYEAYKKAKNDQFSGTDDASLVERLGVPVHIIEGSYDNIKLTTPEDIEIAETILKKRRRGKET